jgi:hypothetical protein
MPGTLGALTTLSGTGTNGSSLVMVVISSN